MTEETHLEWETDGTDGLTKPALAAAVVGGIIALGMVLWIIAGLSSTTSMAVADASGVGIAEVQYQGGSLSAAIENGTVVSSMVLLDEEGTIEERHDNLTGAKAVEFDEAYPSPWANRYTVVALDRAGETLGEQTVILDRIMPWEPGGNWSMDHRFGGSNVW